MSRAPDRTAVALEGPAAPGWPPHLHSRRYVEHYYLAFTLAALAALAAGSVLHGFGALRVCALAVFSSAAAGAVCQSATQWHTTGRARRANLLHTVLIGLLLGLTLPADVAWPVPMFGGLVAVFVGKELLGGLANSLWHPALVGWAVVSLLFAARMAPDSLPFLARDHLLIGSTSAAADADELYHGFDISTPAAGLQAWQMPRPIQVLAKRCYGTQPPDEAPAPNLLPLFRDRLPPWTDTIRGHLGGSIGETCIPVLALAGLWLIYRGYIRWQLPVAALATVTLLAAVWPVQVAAEGGGLTQRWFPVSYTEEGLPVGAAVVLFHLTGGGLWLACLLIATDPVSSPLTARGQVLFGVGLGAVIMVARCNPWYPGAPGAEYWAVLGMNTLVPLIDRLAANRVLGSRLGLHAGRRPRAHKPAETA